MENNDFFTAIEEETKLNEKEQSESEIETPFIEGLPDWDLAPPYETIKRGDSK